MVYLGLPVKNGWIFPWQIVSLPEGNPKKMALFTRFTSKNAGFNGFNQEISDLTKKLRGFFAKKQDDSTHKHHGDLTNV